MSKVISFLDLPEQVRFKIYETAGVVRGGPIDITKECRRKVIFESISELKQIRDPLADCRLDLSQRRERWSSADNDPSLECYCDCLPLQLLTVCHQI